MNARTLLYGVGLMAVLLAVAGFPAAAPAEAGWQGRPDVCGNSRGWSIPGQGGGSPYCTTVDCCNWYQKAHVHDIDWAYNVRNIRFSYKPGYYGGCTDTLKLYTSLDGTTFSYWGSVPTVSRRSGGGWQKYTTTMSLNGFSTTFRYVKIEIPKCYNDWSSVEAVW